MYGAGFEAASRGDVDLRVGSWRESGSVVCAPAMHDHEPAPQNDGATSLDSQVVASGWEQDMTRGKRRGLFPSALDAGRRYRVTSHWTGIACWRSTVRRLRAHGDGTARVFIAASCRFPQPGRLDRGTSSAAARATCCSCVRTLLTFVERCATGVTPTLAERLPPGDGLPTRRSFKWSAHQSFFRFLPTPHKGPHPRSSR